MSGKELSRYWLHCNFITIDGEKISKSLGNTYTLAELSERGFSPLDYKMWVLSGHYQGTRNFTFESLEAAKSRLLNWRNRIAYCYQCDIESDRDFADVLEKVSNNLNSPEGFAMIDNATWSLEDWQKIDDLFGLDLIKSTPNISEEQYDLIHERELARTKKDFARSDEIRDLLASQGIAVRDTADGTVWEYLK